MDKLEILRRILGTGLVAIVRADSSESALAVAQACKEGGVAALEISFTTPGTHHVLEKLAARYQDGSLLLGAGTVLDPETARIAMLSGAQYLISPSFCLETARMANRYRVPYMPGILTLRDAVEALEMGCDVLKLFPGEFYGPSAIKALRAPLPQANIMPVGGVTLANVGDWIRAGAAAVAVGSAISAPAQKGDLRGVAETARAFQMEIQKARGA